MMSIEYFMSSDGVRLAYQKDGNHSALVPLLFLNGLFGDMPFWDTCVAEFSPDRLCIRMDHRGVGLSERWTGVHSYDRFRRDALQLLDLLGVARVHLVGLCHGGMVGALIARDQPERLSSWISLGSRLLRSEKILAFERFRYEVLARDGVVAMSRMQSAHIFGERFLRENAQWLDAMAENAVKRMDVASALPMCAALMEYALREDEVQAMQVPALFLVGEEDLYSPPWLIRRGAKLWPGAQMEILADCAHIIPREAPDLLHGHLRIFLIAQDAKSVAI